MAGLFDNIFGGAGAGGMYADLMTPEQQAQIRRQSMLQVAAKLLEGSGPSPVRRTIGQTLGGALTAGAEAMQTGQTNAVQQMLLRQKLEEAKAERDLRTRAADILSGKSSAAAVTPEAAINAPGGAVGPTTARAANIGAAPTPAPAANDKSTMASRYRELAALFSAVDPLKAKSYMDLAGQLEPQEKFSTTPQFGRSADGTPISYVLSESGGMKLLGVQQSPDYNYQDMGGYVSVRDKRTNKEIERIPKSMSPSESANYGLRMSETDLVETPEGYVRVPKFGGAAQPVVGPTGQPVRGKTGTGEPTEGERKAATLLSRIQIAEAQMAKAPGGAPTMLSGVEPRIMKSSDRKKVEDAQLEFLDAALTLSTGAAYTKEQLEGTRDSYFPRYGDGPQELRDKAERRNNLIQSARIAAGRAAGQVPALPERLQQPTPAAPAAPIPRLGTGTVDLSNYFTRRQ